MINNSKIYLIALFLVYGLFSPPALLADENTDALQAAQNAYLNADYEQAMSILDSVNIDTLTADKQINAYYLKGTIFTALGDTPQAERNFQQILAINPGWQPPNNVSPKIRRFFATEKERAGKILAFTLRDRVVVLNDADTFFELTTNITNLKVELHILVDGEHGIPQEHTFPMNQNSNGYICAVPASYSSVLAKENTLSYYLTVVTKSGALFKIGSQLAPKSITIITPAAIPQINNDQAFNPLVAAPSPEDEKEKARKKKLAIGLGVGLGGGLLVGAIVTTAVILATRSNDNNTENLGSLSLTIRTKE